mmetsp:Transcript_12828/g.17734  ORF Transcript_12828/g.17734 Transcript_12828/m.17734 type:complete len:235 (+) Transcript_12828:151-855(+)
MPLRRSNSTSSIYSNSSIVKPCAELLHYAVSVMICCQILKEGDDEKSSKLDVSFFNESYFTRAKPQTECPGLENIFDFLLRVFKVGQFNADCWIVTLVYTNRLLGLTGMSLTPDNWKPVVIGCLVVAQKVWDDTPLSNVDFTILYPQLKPRHINLLENKILIILQYKLNVSAWLYAFYYFRLRLTCEDSSLFTQQPLSAQKMKTLLYAEPEKTPEKRSMTLIDLPKDRSRGLLN